MGDDVQRRGQDLSLHPLSSVRVKHLLLHKFMLIRVNIITNMIYYLCGRDNLDLMVLVGLPVAEGGYQSIQGLLEALHTLKE